MNKKIYLLALSAALLSACNNGAVTAQNASNPDSSANRDLSASNSELAQQLRAIMTKRPRKLHSLSSSENLYKSYSSSQSPANFKGGSEPYKIIDTSIGSNHLGLGYGVYLGDNSTVNNSQYITSTGRLAFREESIPITMGALTKTTTTLLDQSREDTLSTLGYSVDVGVKGLNFSLGAGMRYAQSLASTKTSLTLTLVRQYKYPVKIDIDSVAANLPPTDYLTGDAREIYDLCSKPSYATPEDKTLCKNAWISYYGQGYMTEGIATANVYLTYRMKFASETAKEEMSAYLKGSIKSATKSADINAQIAKAEQDTNAHAVISMEMVQVGGANVVLDNTTQSGIVQSMLSCSTGLMNGDANSSCEKVGKYYDDYLAAMDTNLNQTASKMTMTKLYSLFNVQPIYDMSSFTGYSARILSLFSTSKDPKEILHVLSISYSENQLAARNLVYNKLENYVRLANIVNNYLDTSNTNPLSKNLTPDLTNRLNVEADKLRGIIGFFKADTATSPDLGFSGKSLADVINACMDPSNVAVNKHVDTSYLFPNCADFAEHLSEIETNPSYKVDTKLFDLITKNTFAIYSNLRPGDSQYNNDSTEYYLVPIKYNTKESDAFALITSNSPSVADVNGSGLYFQNNIVDLRFSGESNQWLSFKIRSSNLINGYYKKFATDSNYASILKTKLGLGNRLNATFVAKADCSYNSINGDSTAGTNFTFETLDRDFAIMPKCHKQTMTSSGQELAYWDCAGVVSSYWDGINNNGLAAKCSWIPYVIKQRLQAIVALPGNVWIDSVGQDMPPNGS